MPEANLLPWETELRDAIAEEIAFRAGCGMAAKSLEKPFRGLLDLFDCRPEVREQGRLRLVHKLNQDSINIAAKRWLSADWVTNDTLHVLSLMLWGTSEASTVPDYWETTDVAGEAVAKMMKWNPAYVMALIQNPESPENAHEEVSLTADCVAEQKDAKDAAWLLMQQLEDVMRNLNLTLISDRADVMLPNRSTQATVGSSKFASSTSAQDVIVSEVANRAARRIVGAEITWLKSLKAEISGDDTCLKSVWEEICVQVQGEESFFWDTYKDTVITDLGWRIEQLKQYQKLALWLQTEQGFDWTLDQREDASGPNCAPTYSLDDIAEYLWTIIWQRADTYSNSRIRQWIESQYARL